MSCNNTGRRTMKMKAKELFSICDILSFLIQSGEADGERLAGDAMCVQVKVRELYRPESWDRVTGLQGTWEEGNALSSGVTCRYDMCSVLVYSHVLYSSHI